MVDVLDKAYGVTLWTFVQFQDADRMTRAMETRRQLDFAHLVPFAVWEPSKLTQIEQQFTRSLRGEDSGVTNRERGLQALARSLRRKRPQQSEPSNG